MSIERVKSCILQTATWSLVMSVASSITVPRLAQALDQEPAAAWTAGDSRLQWGPCPAFMPAGCTIAVLHGDPGKPNVDVLFQVPAHSKLPLHWHTSPERMVLIAGELRVTYDGQPPMTLKPGTYAYGPARRPHGGLCTSAVPCILFIAFEAPLDAAPIESKAE